MKVNNIICPLCLTFQNTRATHVLRDHCVGDSAMLSGPSAGGGLEPVTFWIHVGFLNHQDTPAPDGAVQVFRPTC